MKRTTKSLPLIASLGMVATWALPAQADSVPTFRQTPIRLKASEELPKDLLRGDNFTVHETVANDGMVNVYEVMTDYDDLTVVSNAELIVRIGELRAMTVMEEMSQSKEFGGGVAEGVKAPVKGGGALVTSPVQTTKGIFSGTGRYLSNVGRSFTSGDPHQDNVFSTALGYDAAKRVYAYELGIDPHTGFKPAADALGRIARASVAGGLTVAVGTTAAVGGTAGTVLSATSTGEDMRQLSRDNPPGTLRRINTEKLEKMGIDSELVQAFVANQTYTPQERTILVGELETMDGVAGRDVFISNANLATDEATAFFWRITAQMLAGYHAHVAPAARLINLAGFPTIQTRDGALIVLSADDHVFLTESLYQYLQNVKAGLEQVPGVKSMEFWNGGKVDPELRKYALSLGWKVVAEADKKVLK